MGVNLCQTFRDQVKQPKIRARNNYPAVNDSLLSDVTLCEVTAINS